MKTIAFIFLMFGAMSVMATPPAEEGKTIFSARCAACHNVNKVLTGPALAGVTDRRSVDWIINFVHSSQTLVRSGDTSAVALFEKFNKIQMPDHPDLTADDIKNVLAYIKAETKTGPVDVAPFAKPSKLHPGYTPLSFSDDYVFFLLYFAMVAMLVFALLALVKVKALQRNNQIP
jgi:mono/diheme cytochrome c family protein